MIDYTGSKAISLPHRMQNNFSFDADELLSLVNNKTKHYPQLTGQSYGWSYAK